MANKKEEQVSFRVDPAVKKAFDRALVDKDETAAYVLRSAMAAYSGSEERSPIIIPESQRETVRLFLEYLNAEFKDPDRKWSRHHFLEMLHSKRWRKA